MPYCSVFTCSPFIDRVMPNKPNALYRVIDTPVCVRRRHRSVLVWLAKMPMARLNEPFPLCLLNHAFLCLPSPEHSGQASCPSTPPPGSINKQNFSDSMRYTSAFVCALVQFVCKENKIRTRMNSDSISKWKESHRHQRKWPDREIE